MRKLIARQLTQMDVPGQDAADIIYVLGGGLGSTRHHLQLAADLYHRGASKKILYYHKAGAMVTDRSLGKAMGRDAWVVKRLAAYGVPASATEAVVVPERFWGTYSEAQVVSGIVVRRQFKRLLLISSPHHTRRVRQCFRSFLPGQGVALVVAGSGDRAYLREHLVEYLKLKVYELLLL